MPPLAISAAQFDIEKLSIMLTDFLFNANNTLSKIQSATIRPVRFVRRRLATIRRVKRKRIDGQKILTNRAFQRKIIVPTELKSDLVNVQDLISPEIASGNENNLGDENFVHDINVTSDDIDVNKLAALKQFD